MKRAWFSKFAALAGVLSLSTVLAVFDSEARQSNIYSLNVSSGGNSGGNYEVLDHDWTMGKLDEGGCFGLQQWTRHSVLLSSNGNASGWADKVQTDIRLGTRSITLGIPVLLAAILIGVALLLTCWVTLAGAIWWINRRGRKEMCLDAITNRGL